MTSQNPESLEAVLELFGDVDEAVRERAAERVAAGADAHSALAHETTVAQLVKAYSRK